ncbi:MAG TPA: 50S ribosomal protein L25 [Firmicutes bacterium]|nr:50S ribosomal protein L25 [Candidatus Fermentithermobacillaceae bacterium]
MEAAVRATRRGTGKAAAKACRRAGLVPAVVYGKSIEPMAISLDQEGVKELLRHSRAHVHNLVVEEPPFEGSVMVQDVRYDPMTGKVLHIDLHKISMTDKVKTEVAVEVKGEESLEKRGFLLQRQAREVTVECLPNDIPAVFEIDVANLQPGESITAGDLAIPKSVRLVTSPAEVLVVALAPKSVEQEAEEAGEEASADEGKPESDR